MLVADAPSVPLDAMFSSSHLDPSVRLMTTLETALDLAAAPLKITETSLRGVVTARGLPIRTKPLAGIALVMTTPCGETSAATCPPPHTFTTDRTGTVVVVLLVVVGRTVVVGAGIVVRGTVVATVVFGGRAGVVVGSGVGAGVLGTVVLGVVLTGRVVVGAMDTTGAAVVLGTDGAVVGV